MKYKNIINKKFGKLTPLKRISNIGKKTKWLCLCDCGNKIEVFMSNLSSKTTKSCGCLKHTAGISKRKGIETTYLSLYNSYKRRAIKENRQFLLSLEDFKNIIKNNCHYCGEYPKAIFNPYKHSDGSYISGKSSLPEYIETLDIVYNGIDRKDNNEGYTLENSVACCAKHNYMKQEMNEDTFLKEIEKIYLHKIKILD